MLQNNDNSNVTFPVTHYMSKQINLTNLDKLIVTFNERKLFYNRKNQNLRIIYAPNVSVRPEGCYDSSDGRYYSAVQTFANLLKEPSTTVFETMQCLRTMSPQEFNLRMKEMYPAYGDLPPLHKPLETVYSENQYANPNSDALSRTYAYLCDQRKIDKALVNELIEKRQLMLDRFNNLCFLTYENENLVAIQKVGTDPKKRFARSYHKKRNTCFTYFPGKSDKIENLYVFESCIELLSYLTLVKLNLVPPLHSNSALIGMNEMYIHLIEAFDRSHKIKRIIDCTKNYTAADPVAEKIKKYGSFNGIEVQSMRQLLVDFSREHGYASDWNRMLCQHITEQPST